MIVLPQEAAILFWDGSNLNDYVFNTGVMFAAVFK